MKKRFLSLLCVLALCLGLLPVTALAAGEDAPGTLWVGRTQITASGYWKTNPDGTLTTEGANKDNYNVYYDGNGTLTLKDATIQGRGLSGNPQPEDYGIYAAPTGNQSVSLTINLMGSNTVSGYCGICVETTTADNASLVIQPAENDPQGSLEAIGNKYNGITISSGSGNASLTINNAPVVAISNSPAPSSYHGVCIKTGNATAPALSLLVNGGSLTAQGESGYGIYFYMGNSTTDPSTSLTIQNNALVKATPSIFTSNNLSKPDTTAGSESGGIVFDGKSGTVYGKVKLQEDLEIGTDETLTIGKDASLTVPENVKLTNNGKIDNSGELNGTVDGSGTVTPKITTDSLPDGTVNQLYTATLQATGNNITWSASGLPDGLTLNSNGTITGIPSAEGTSTVTVTATNASGSDSKEYTLNIKSATVPVTAVTLNPTELSLYTGQSETLAATVTPDTATNKNVTWSSDRTEVATVEDGTVKAVGAGTAIITVTTADGGKQATCKVTVTQSNYSITSDKEKLNFGSVYTGYTQPAAQMVTITNTGNQQVTVTLPTANDFIITAGTGFTNGSAAIEPDGTATFTVQPKAGLAVGTYSENITISGTHDVNATISATFTVKQYSSGGGTPTKTPSQQATDKIEAAKDGSTVEIKLSTGSTKLDKEVFEELAGRDVTLEISVPGGITWTVNGQDIPENADLTDLDLGVTLDASTIPVSVVNTITGAVDTIQISLKHDGEFGFTMTLSAPLGKTNAGYWANLYWYNERTEELEFQQAARIARDGTAEFALDHASDYAIIIDDRSHEPVDLPFNDVPEGYWAYDAIQYVYGEGLMAGTSATTFAPDVTTSRAMIATILWRMAGSPVVNYAMNYTDVAQGQWCSEAIRWATSEGVVTGYGNGLFGTNDPITREQLATMLWRYAQTEGYDVSIGEDTNILSYTDVANLSEYAIPAMQWAVGAGIINGTGDGSTLTPQGQATRAQAATVLMRFCEQSIQ